jgi:hypothetical protein
MSTCTISVHKNCLLDELALKGHKRNLANNNGGPKLTMGIMNFTKEANLKEGKTGPIERKFFVFFFLFFICNYSIH